MALATLAALLTDPRAARAQATTAPGPPLDLAWSAPETCPDLAHVVARVDALVGRRPPEQQRLVARGRITQARARTSPLYRLELTIDRSGGTGGTGGSRESGGSGRPEASTRTMSGDDCARLAEAAALILALDIDPDALTRRDDAAARADAAPPPAVTPEPAITPEPSAAPPPPRRPRAAARPATPRPVTLDGVASARIILDSGSLPRRALGLGAAAELARGPLALDVQLAAYAPQFTVNGPRQGVGGAYVDLATFGALGCWGGVALPIDLRGCLGGEIGRIATRGVSIAHPEQTAAFWSAVTAMLRLRVFPDRLVSPMVGLALVHPTTAPSVRIQGFGRVFEPAPLLLRFFLGLEARIL